MAHETEPPLLHWWRQQPYERQAAICQQSGMTLEDLFREVDLRERHFGESRTDAEQRALAHMLQQAVRRANQPSASSES